MRSAIARSPYVASRADFCRKAGIDPATLSRYEFGTRHPRLDQLEAWAKVLGCRVQALVPDAARSAQHPLLDEVFAHEDVLREFILSPWASGVTPAEIEELRRYPFERRPTLATFHYFLQGLRAGLAPEDAADEAELTVPAYEKARAKGGRPPPPKMPRRG